MLVTVDCRMSHSSGIGTYIRNIVDQLLQLEVGLRYQILVPQPDFLGTPLPEGSFETIVRSSIYSLAEQRELPFRVHPESRLLWTPHYNMPLLLRRRRVVTIHDIMHVDFAEYARHRMKRLYANLMFASVARYADHLLFVSEFTRQRFSSHFPLARTKGSVVYNAVSPIWRRAVSAGPDRAASGAPYIVYVGNVKPHKNLQTLVEAMRRVRASSNIELKIVGKRDGFRIGSPELVAEIERTGAGIHFTGFVSDEDLVELVRGAQLMVFPSLYEGFGLPPLEAMTVGCPVVASDIEAIREACGDAALLVDPMDAGKMADAILTVLHDRGTRDGLIERGYRRVERFSARQSADAIAHLFLKTEI